MILLKYTQAEMLDMWKLKLHIAPLQTNCSIIRSDGIDIDALLILKINEWYSNLLNTAPHQWLPVEDISNDIFVCLSTDGVASIKLPDYCVRPIEWRMEGWKQSVTEFLEPNHPIALQQSNLFLRAGCENPVATINGNILNLFSIPAGAGGTVDMARCVIHPTDGNYIFATCALASITDYINQINLS